MSDIHIEDPGGRLIKTEAAERAGLQFPEPNLVLLTGAYCPKGCALIREDAPRFDGFAGITLHATWEDRQGDLVLSPFQGDKRKLGPQFPEGAMLELSCPSCGTPLSVIGPCECGGEFVALYTVKTPDPGYLVGLCRRWGCFRSFLEEGGRLVTEYRVFEDMDDR